MAKKENNDNSDDMIVDLDRDDMVIDDSKVATAAEEKCRELIASLDQRNSWQYSSKGVQAKRAAKAINSLKHGTYARVPIICKGDGCPYGRSCYLLQSDLAPEREPCPIEADKVERLVAGYASIRAYQEQYGIPQEGASPEAKEAYDKALNGMLTKTNAVKTKVLNDYGKGIAKEEHMIRQGLAMSPDTDFSKEEVENIMSEAWGVGEMHAGILDVLNQTASARATALGITRFRGTDGAMSTMGSIGSLFLKNNDSLTNEASIALLAGGTLTAGMAVGKAVGAAGSAIGSND